jgi:hypothetical protein
MPMPTGMPGRHSIPHRWRDRGVRIGALFQDHPDEVVPRSTFRLGIRRFFLTQTSHLVTRGLCVSYIARLAAAIDDDRYGSGARLATFELEDRLEGTLITG